jgi:GcrA cell cycle regulator
MTSGRYTWVWTDEKVSELRRLWADPDLRAREIGALLGVTRAAIIGKANRINLAKRRFVDTPRASRPSRARPHAERAPQPPRLKPVPIPKHEDPCGQPWEPMFGVTPVTLIDLEAGMCKWPVTEGSPFLFCGAPALDGKPYCKHHGNWSVGIGSSFERHALTAARSADRQEAHYGHRSLVVVL